MRARIWVAAVALLAMAGCGSDQESPAPAPSTPSTLSSEAIAKAAEAAGIPPKPDQATIDAYLAALRKIDPEIVGDKDPDRIVDRGRDQCVSIKEWGKKDPAKVLLFANTRFTSPDHPDGFGEAKAKKINEAVRKYICPTY